MRVIILFTFILLAAQILQAQYTTIIYTDTANQNTSIATSGVLFKTPEYIYFKQAAQVYKIHIAKTIDISGGNVTELPSTTYEQDMYEFTRKGKAAIGLYITGSIFSLIGAALILSTDNSTIPGVITLVGGVISFSGVVSMVSEWKYGYRASVKAVLLIIIDNAHFSLLLRLYIA